MSKMSEGEYQENYGNDDEPQSGSWFITQPDPTNWRLIAPHIKEALDRWNAGQPHPTGDFLRAVLSNDLMGVFRHGDAYNLKTLHAIVAYVYNELRNDNHGSPEKYEAWWRGHQAQEEMRREELADNGE